MESEEDGPPWEALRASLQGHFEGFDMSQKQLKALLISVDAKVDALAKTISPLHTAALANANTSGGRGVSVTTISSSQAKLVQGSGRISNVPISAVPSSLSDKADSLFIADATAASLIGHSDSARSGMCRGIPSIQSVDLESEVNSQIAGVTDDREALALRHGFQDFHAPKYSCVEGDKGSKPRPSVSRVLSDFARLGESSSRSITPGFASRFQAWSPDSRPRRILDIIGMILVIYDAFMVPFWLAWDFTWQVGFWTTCVFWTIDLPSQFVTGFRKKDARLELDLGKAALYYMKTWFVLDITVVLCDWIAALGDVSATMRYLRVMRLVRGGRQVLRFFLALQQYKLSSQFLEVHLSVDITLLLAFILWVNHVVCCGWYRIGANAHSDTGRTWVREAELSDVGTPYEYSTSLHWALTQMTPASMEVVPECTVERAFNVLIIVAGMILGSVFAATLTSSMTQYRLYKERVSNNFMQLQSYLGQQGVEPELSMAVKMHVKNQLSMRQRLQWKNVAYLDVVSKSLKEALWHSCCMKCIRRHPFLHSLNLFDHVAMTALCNGAITTITYSRGDIVFEVGAEAKEGRMYYIVLGAMFYDPGILAAEITLDRDDPKLHLGEGAFVSEAALWTDWKHLGTLFVEHPSEVLALNSSRLQEALSHRFPDVMAIIVQYCVAFHANLHELGGVRSDLGSSVDNLDIMSALETPVCLVLAEPILEQLRTNGNRFGQKKVVNNLEAEIQDGKCNLGFEDEEPVRTVFVVALKIWRNAEDDRFLVKLGEVVRDTGEYKAGCVLPGTKRKNKETSRVALERIFYSEFEDLIPYITVLQGSTKTIFLKNSPTFGVRTRYLRTTYNAALDHDCELNMAEADWAPTGSTERRRPSGVYSQQLLSKRRLMSMFRTVRSTSGRESFKEDPDARVMEKVTNGRIIEILREHDQVMLMPSDNARTACTMNVWLTQEEFNILQQDAATPFIQSWLQTVDVPRPGSEHGEDSTLRPLVARSASKASVTVNPDPSFPDGDEANTSGHSAGDDEKGVSPVSQSEGSGSNLEI